MNLRIPNYNFLFLLLFMMGTGCTSETKSTEISFEEIKKPVPAISPLDYDSSGIPVISLDTCTNSAGDFFKLAEKKVQSEFFRMVDSIKKDRYPDTESDSIFIELTPDRLNQFMADLDRSQFLSSGMFEKDYYFDLAPYQYKDSKDCRDKISVTFDKEECSFRIIVFNEFFEEWCQESNVIYIFEIDGFSIKSLQIHEAG